MTQHIDEPRSNGKPRRVDFGFPMDVFPFSHSHNLVAVDRDISDDAGFASSVVQSAIPDNDVILGAPVASVKKCCDRYCDKQSSIHEILQNHSA